MGTVAAKKRGGFAVVSKLNALTGHAAKLQGRTEDVLELWGEYPPARGLDVGKRSCVFHGRLRLTVRMTLSRKEKDCSLRQCHNQKPIGI